MPLASSQIAKPAYIGRFAPSPTGPLHLGSLITALGSYMIAHSHAGKWLLRFEDVDSSRTVPSSASDILKTLEEHGLYWDAEVVFQSKQTEYYQHAFDQLKKLDCIYACQCSRKNIAHNATRNQYGRVYPGTCRTVGLNEQDAAIRVKVDNNTILFRDSLQGPLEQNLQRDIGDFVIKRRDNLFAYQLAVVVDDALAGITEVVRGADLLINTPRQIFLQKLLGYWTPTYAHLPVLTNREGQKLSKQTFAEAVSNTPAINNLLKAWSALGQATPDIRLDSVGEFFQWAHSKWQLTSVPRGPISIDRLI